MKLKKGDMVAIIAGKDQFKEESKKGKVRNTGKIIKVFHKDNKVLVEGINKIKKHQAPTQQNDKGKIITKEAPIDASNVAILDPKTKEPTRVGIKVVNNKKVRYAKKSGTVLDK